MRENGEYDFVRVSPEHFEDFVSLANTCHGGGHTLGFAERLFDTARFGAEYIGYMAYHRETGEPAAFYGIFPCYAEIDGCRILAAQSGATMTHPAHRRRNLFVSLGEKTFELARTSGISFVYGFPNEFSYRGLMRLGWSHSADMVRYRVFVLTAPIGLGATYFKPIKKLQRRLFRWAIGKRKEKYRPFPSSVLEPGVGGIHRSAEAFEYKPEDENHAIVRVGDSLVWINRAGGEIGIGDIRLGKETDFSSVLKVLKRVARLSGCNAIRTYVSPGCSIDRLFRSAGYKPEKGLPICHLDLLPGADSGRFQWVYGDFDTF
jgi:hypothetical protein